MHGLWSTPDFRTLLVRIAFGGLFALLGLPVLLRPLPAFAASLSTRDFNRRLIAIFGGLRLLLFVVLYVVLHQQVRGDLPSYYLPEATLASQPCRPYPYLPPEQTAAMVQKLRPGNTILPCTIYRDFPSSYGPLNPYMNAALLRLYPSPLTLVAFAILCDILCVPVWLAFLRRFVPEDAVRKTGILLLLQPVVLWNAVMNGRNEALLSLLLGTALYLVARRDRLSGAVFTLPILLVKFLPLLYVPNLLLAARRRMHWILGAILAPIVVYGFFLWIGSNILMPFQQEANRGTAGGFFYAFSSITGVMLPGGFQDRLTALSLAAMLIVVARQALRATSDGARLWVLNSGMVITMLTLLIASKKSYPVYLAGLAAPLAAYVVVAYTRGRSALAAVYSILVFTSLFATSIWYWPLNLVASWYLHARIYEPGGWTWAVALLAMTIPAFCCAWLLVDMVRDLDRPAQA